MDYSPEELKTVARMLEIPTLPDEQRTWIVRTKGGSYYEDFSRNDFIALGWNKIPLSWIVNANRPKEDVIEDIKDEYPDEKRPGLIYGQLVDFVRVMSSGDYVVIPSRSSAFVNIGIVGELYEEEPVPQELFVEDYEQCSFRLRRKVRWLREVSSSEDVYLSKMLRAQQTISDISKYANLIYRNLYDFYFIDGTLSLTIRKTTDDPVDFLDITILQGQIASIIQSFREIFEEDFLIEQKAAMSSPGFIELISTKVVNPIIMLLYSFIFKVLGGKTPTADGKTATGLAGFAQAISNLFNDKADRDLKRAEAKKYLAEAAKTEADADKSRAEAKQIDAATGKTIAETQRIQAETAAANIENIKSILEIFGPSSLDDSPEKLMNSSKKLQKEISSAEDRYIQLEPILDRLGIKPPVIEGSNVIPFPGPRKQ